MKKYLIVLFSLAIIAFLLVIFCNAKVDNASENRLYNQVSTIPYNKVGLLLGTSKMTQGRENLYYNYRIDAAFDLLKSKKIRYLVISGDNGQKDYNEPQMMKADLVAKGIDSNCIFLDYAGFRTFDSVIRLKEIFGQNNATIISQPFHNKRAIYIASANGMNTIGYNAKDVAGRGGVKVQLREKLARVKVFIDMLIDKQPKYLGEKINIPN